MQRRPYLVSQPKQGVHLASLGKPTLSVWQSAILAYASAKCGITFTSIEQTDKWLRSNPLNPQHLTIKAVCGLLVVEPPKKSRDILTDPPPKRRLI
jgi:hypothetical protein